MQYHVVLTIVLSTLLLTTGPMLSPAEAAPPESAPDTFVESDSAEDDGDGGVLLDPTIVSATPVPQTQSTLGSSVTVITAEQMEERGITDLREAVEISPGTHIGQTGSRGAVASLFIRGGESDYTVVLIDGVRVNQVGGFFDFGKLTVSDIERIEVLRGAQSALYGAEAMSGVVNIITKKGEGPPTWAWDVAGGSRETYKATGTVSGGFERGNYRFSVARHATANLGGVKEDDFRELTIGGRVGFQPTEDLDFDLTVRLQQYDKQNPGQYVRPGFIEDLNDTLAGQELALGFTATHQIRDNWEHRFRATFYDEELEGDDQTQENPPGALTSVDTIITRSTTRVQRHTLDYRHSMTLLDDHIVTVGGAYQNEWGRVATVAPPFPLGFGNFSASKTVESRSAYAQLQSSFFEETLNIQAGVRHDNSSFFGNKTSPRVAASVLVPQTQTRVHGSWGRAIKTPNAAEINSPNGRLLDPEEAVHWDVGVEQRLFDDRLIFDVTYFNQDFDKRVVFQTLPAPPFFAVSSSGTAEAYGLEVSGRAEFRPDLVGQVAYTYMETANTSTPTATRTGHGQSLDRRPKHQASARLTYRPEPWYATVDVRYVGESNEPDAFDVFRIDPLTFGPPPFPVRNEDYVVVNLSGGYTINQYVELYGSLTNLLDDHYENVFGFEATGITALIGARGSF